MNKLLKTLLVFALVAFAGGLMAQQPSNMNQISEKDMSSDMVYRVLRDMAAAQKSYVASSATLASTTVSVSWTGGTQYTVNGVPSGVMVASSVPLSGTTVPTGYYCRFLVWIDASGLVGVTQGRMFTSDIGDAAYPPAPANKAVFGGVRIYARGNPFIPGSSFITHADYTNTLFNLTRRPVTFTNLQAQ